MGKNNVPPSLRWQGGFSMSRSYKKTPIYKAKSQTGRKIANRIVRRRNRVHVLDIKEYYVQDGGGHRKETNSYDVIDWVRYYPRHVWIQDVSAGRVTGTENDWARRCRRK